MFASKNVDRTATMAVDRKWMPVFGFQEFPDSVNHKIWLIPKRVRYKPDVIKLSVQLRDQGVPAHPWSLAIF